MSQLIQIFIDNIVPILLIASIGIFVGRRFSIDPRPFGTLLFYILSPALVFNSLYTSQVGGDEFALLFIASLMFLFTMAAVTYLILRLVNVSARSRASVILASFAHNAGNFGLPLASFAFGPEVFSRAVIVFIANTVMGYSLGVIVASSGNPPQPGESILRRALMNVLKTPVIYAVALAFVLKGIELQLPLVIDRSVNLLAEATIPLMLIMLGLQLGQSARLDHPKLLSLGVSIKLLLAPLIAVGFSLLFGLNSLASAAFITQASMPTAVFTIILATEFDLDRDLSLNLILASTLLSPITLSVILLLLRQTL